VGDGRTSAIATALSMVAGRRSHRLFVAASNASDPASFHIEAEAPEGLQISSRETLFDVPGRRPDAKIGSHTRVHIHYSNLPSRAKLAIMLRVGPRSSTVVRGAALTSAMTMLAVLYARLRLKQIVASDATAGAAVLLVIPTLLAVWVARADEHPATTHLLWPIRIVATAPGIFGFVAAGVLASGGDAFWAKVALWVCVGLLGISTWILMRTWQRASSRERRRATTVEAGDGPAG
jgi:hypothetical protein